MPERPSPALLVKLGRLQAERPWLFVLIAALSLIPAAFAARGLGFRADFAELLPDNKESVVEMRRVSQRLPGVTTLTVAAEIADGKNRASARAIRGCVLVPKLRALGPDMGRRRRLRSTARLARFFEENKFLYAKLDDLKQAHRRDRRALRLRDRQGSKARCSTTRSRPRRSAPSASEKRLSGKTERARRRSPSSTPTATT